MVRASGHRQARGGPGRWRRFAGRFTAAAAVAALAVVAAVLLRSGGGAPEEPRPSSAACDLYAAPAAAGGNGTRARPFAGVRPLVRSLKAGQVGCLVGGRFRHRGVVKLRRPRVTLRAAGADRPTIDGAIWVLPSARETRIAGLNLVSHDPEFTIPLKIQADHVTIAGNDITASTSISCVLIGSGRLVTGTVIEHNRIRRCGRRGEHDHLIYVQGSRGAVIRNNLLIDNAGGWAVHLYPDADSTLVEGNIIDGNKGGVIFAGAYGDTSDRNVVRGNAISASSPRFNVEASWSGEQPGVGNRTYRNCLFSTGPAGPAGVTRQPGFAASGNVVVPRRPYVDPRGGDFRLRDGSPCASLLGGAARTWMRRGPP